ncbi:MAG TPA: hypothetical protein DEQ02_03590 [Ruminococcaceae bacterium]|nr:hypothetical protein [Oscillospiraceae bacterium]
MKRFYFLGLLFIVVLTGCSALDVVNNDSVRAFGDVLAVLPAKGDEENVWRVTAPDGGAQLVWDNQTVSVTVDVQPFITAGLNTDKLENGTVNGDTLIYTAPSFNMLNQEEQKGALNQFEKDLRFLRDKLGYHMEMEHYTLDLGDAMFEWAKDIDVNDKDIVFALNPDPLVAAGVDPENVDGWVYTQVSVHVDGKPTDVWKLLKPINLK